MTFLMNDDIFQPFLIGGYPIFSPKLMWDDQKPWCKATKGWLGGEIAHAKGGIPSGELT